MQYVRLKIVCHFILTYSMCLHQLNMGDHPLTGEGVRVGDQNILNICMQISLHTTGGFESHQVLL